MGKKVNKTVRQPEATSCIQIENGCKFILKIKQNEQGRLTGSVQPLISNSPLEFYEIGSLMLALDRLIDVVKEAESEGTVKFFNSKIYEKWVKKEIERGSIVREIPKEERNTMQKGTELFFVCVKYRNYGSWQGEIQWNGKATKYFRSELELLHLIQSVFVKKQ